MSVSKDMDHVVIDLVEPINRYFHIPLARQLVKLLVKTPITPNQVTWASVILGLAAGYYFSRAEASSLLAGGILLEICMIFDCVDGQLARAKNLASDWGRIIDGIGDYTTGIAIVIGLWIGYPQSGPALGIIALITILRSISYDFIKESMTARIKEGVDGGARDIRTTFEKIQAGESGILKLYFYYLQFQQLLFHRRWSSLGNYAENLSQKPLPGLWNPDKRKRFYQNNRGLMILWKWSGKDLVFFLFVIFSVSAILEEYLQPVGWFLGIQFLLTFSLHHLLVKHETAS